jgi:hypothetical protein
MHGNAMLWRCKRSRIDEGCKYATSKEGTYYGHGVILFQCPSKLSMVGLDPTTQTFVSMDARLKAEHGENMLLPHNDV